MDFVSLLGKNLSDPMIRGVFESLLTQPELDDDGYCEIHNQGIEFHFGTNGALATVFLFRRGVAGGQHVEPFQGLLPKGLQFEMDQEQVHSLLGKPSESRAWLEEKGVTPLPFDKYLFDGWSLHLTFEKELSSIALVTIEQRESHNQ